MKAMKTQSKRGNNLKNTEQRHTEILVIDDVRKPFDFEKFYIALEERNKLLYLKSLV